MPLVANLAHSVGGDIGGAHGELAAVGHGVARIDRQIDDHLLELRQVDLHRPQIAAVHHLQRHLLADQPLEQHAEIVDRLAQVEHLRAQRLLAREGQELPHQRRGAVGVLLDLDDVLERRIGRLVGVEQEVGRHHDGGQHVVEVVRDAAGELADQFHLLLLLHAAFQRALGGRFERVDDGRFAVAVVLVDRGDEEIGEALARSPRAPLPPARCRPRPAAALAIAASSAGAVALGHHRQDRALVALEQRPRRRRQSAHCCARCGRSCRRSRSPSACSGRSA